MKKDFAKGYIAGFLTIAIIAGGCYVGSKVNGSNKGESISDKTVTKMNLLEKVINKSYLGDVDTEKLEQGVYKGLMYGLEDPYSEYYTAEEYKELQESLSGSYYGIGVMVTQNTETGVITVVRVFKDAPGDKAGMMADDILYKVEDEEVTGVDIDSVVTKIKGAKGTKVNVTVYRPSEKKYVDLEITRDEVSVPTVEYKMLTDNIGYVEIVQFEAVTYDQFTEAMEELKSQGMESVIFDVRDNPGGMYSIVVSMLDDLLPEGTIVYTEDKEGDKSVEYSDKECLDMPMVVLQNGDSASAAEIFAGAIKDYGVGEVIGTTSFGKGIVQTILPLTDGSAIKITIEKYFTPNGINIHDKGIEPDIEVEDDLDTEEDEQLQKAIEVLSK